MNKHYGKARIAVCACYSKSLLIVTIREFIIYKLHSSEDNYCYYYHACSNCNYLTNISIVNPIMIQIYTHIYIPKYIQQLNLHCEPLHCKLPKPTSKGTLGLCGSLHKKVM